MKLARLVGVLALFTVAAAACGTSGTGAVASSVRGAGSSFQDTYQQTAAKAFGDREAKAGRAGSVQYTKSGSSDGKSRLAAGTVDFAGSDSPIKPDELANFGGRKILFFPVIAAPITMSFHLHGITNLQLSADSVAGIVMGRIAKWDDAALRADNPNAKLPATPVTFVHRSDGSGTTSNFTKYLAAAAPNVFTLTPGETTQWAVGQSGQGGTGVTSIIKQTDGAIGYVDLPDAAKEDLDVAAIRNKAGNYVKPTPAAAGAAVANSTPQPNLTYNPLEAAGSASYPITAPTYVLVDGRQVDPAKASALKAYLRFLLTEGQSSENTTQLFYAKLPEPLRAMALVQVEQIKVG